MKVQPRTVDAIEYPMLDVDTKIINGHPKAGEYQILAVWISTSHQ